MMKYTVYNAISGALQDAADKENSGLLFKSSDDIPEELLDNCETVYSLISLYSDDENNDGTWEDQIEEALYEIYPDYF